jgi:hypothetical protein
VVSSEDSSEIPLPKDQIDLRFFCCDFFGESASSDGFACGAVPPFYGQTVLPFF